MRIRFKRDTSFRKQFFVPDSFAHPAKMDAQLLIWIVNKYSEAGETILDPMAGSGTTMLACTLGRNCLLIELEDKFCKMMRDNWEQVKMRPQLGSTIGSCQIIQGDARQLEGLVDKIITSPPYAAALKGQDQSKYDDPKYQEKMAKLPSGDYSTPGRLRALKSHEEGYSQDPSNIGNLPYGEIDKCIFSPPYAEQMHETGSDEFKAKKAEYAKKHLGGVSRTSLIMQHSGEQKSPNNIAKLPYGQIDKIVTSPPYEGSIDKGNENFEGIKLHQAGMSREDLLAMRREAQLGYGETNNNIGNLKSQSYLEAMLQVYQNCYGVLRADGLMVLVVKNFIRNKQVIRLDLDTIKLCEQAGFSFVERHERVLPSQSFWRIIYHQRHPEVEQIKSEDVLVFQKRRI